MYSTNQDRLFSNLQMVFLKINSKQISSFEKKGLWWEMTQVLKAKLNNVQIITTMRNTHWLWARVNKLVKCEVMCNAGDSTCKLNRKTELELQ